MAGSKDRKEDFGTFGEFFVLEYKIPDNLRTLFDYPFPLSTGLTAAKLDRIRELTGQFPRHRSYDPLLPIKDKLEEEEIRRERKDSARQQKQLAERVRALSPSLFDNFQPIMIKLFQYG